jgi:protein phosphatase PTC7
MSRRTGVIDTAVLGDSSYVIIRDGCIYHRSPVQQHSFNYPYQLSVGLLLSDTVKPVVLDSAVQQEVSPSSVEYIPLQGPVTPVDALIDHHQLQNGDLLLLATDGLFDNLYDSDILQTIDMENLLITNATQWNEDLEDALCRTARRLVQSAWSYSHNPRRLSPWAQAARELGEAYPMGG